MAMGMRARKRVGLALVVAIAVVGLAGSICTSRSLMGRVLDESGKPVAGAVVAVAWRVHSGHVAQMLVAKEAVTSASGHFIIEGWTMLSPMLFGRVDAVHVYAVKAGRVPAQAYFNLERGAVAYRSKTASLELVSPTRDPLAALQYEKVMQDLRFDLCRFKTDSSGSGLWLDTPRFMSVLKQIEPSSQDRPDFQAKTCEL